MPYARESDCPDAERVQSEGVAINRAVVLVGKRLRNRSWRCVVPVIVENEPGENVTLHDAPPGARD
jgi:hypothetical protein